MPIYDCCHVHEAARSADECNVDGPNLIGPIDHQIPEKVGVDFRLFVPLAGVWTRIENMDAHLLHIASEKPFSDLVVAQLGEFLPNTPYTIGGLLIVNSIDGILYVDLGLGNNDFNVLMVSSGSGKIQQLALVFDRQSRVCMLY